MDGNSAINVFSGEALPEGVSPDDAFEILADEQRRCLLRILSDLKTQEHIRTLTRDLAAAMDVTDENNVERLRLHLYHCHIPKLANADLVAVENRRWVRLTDAGRVLATAVDY